MLSLLFKKFFQKANIKTKLMSAMASVLFIVFTALFIITSLVVSTEINNLTELELKGSLNLLHTVIQTKKELLLDEAKRLAEKHELITALTEKKSDKVLEALDLSIEKNKTKVKEADVFDENTARLSKALSIAIVVDNEGNVIARQNNRNQTGDNLLINKNYPVVKYALTGTPKKPQAGSVSGFVVLDKKELMNEVLDKQAKVIIAETGGENKQRELNKGLFIMAGVPIKGDNGKIVGAVIVGHLVNHDYDLVNYHNAIGSKTTNFYNYKAYSSIYLEDIIVSTSIPVEVEGQEETRNAIGIEKKAGKQTQMLTIGKKKYIITNQPIIDINGREIGAFSTALPTDVFSEGTLRLYVILAGLMLISLVFTLSISYRLNEALIIKPINCLDKAAQEVSEGDYMQEIPVEAGRDDELTRLSLNFNEMVTDLRNLLEENVLTRADLEEKLTDLLVIVDKISKTPDIEQNPQLSNDINEMLGKLINLIPNKTW